MRWLNGITSSMDMNLGKPIMLDPGLLAFIHIIFKTNLLTFIQLIKPQYYNSMKYNGILYNRILIRSQGYSRASLVVPMVKKSACSAGDSGFIPGLG